MCVSPHRTQFLINLIDSSLFSYNTKTISCIDVSRTMEIERDVIFTPNETAQVAGKIVFYNSNDISEIGSHDGYGDKIHETEQNERFAWLKPLKHALYLVLNNKINTSSTKRYDFQCD